MAHVTPSQIIKNPAVLVEHNGWCVSAGRIPGHIEFFRTGKGGAEIVARLNEDEVEIFMFGRFRVIEGTAEGLPNIKLRLKKD